MELSIKKTEKLGADAALRSVRRSTKDFGTEEDREECGCL
jgi:hypothetical protein